MIYNDRWLRGLRDWGVTELAGKRAQNVRQPRPVANPADFVLNLQHLADLVPGMIAVYNIDTGKYVYVNGAAKKLLGYTAKEFIEGGIEFATSIVHPDDLPGVMAQNRAALKVIQKAKPGSDARNPIVTFKYRMRHKKGHWVWIRTDGSVYDWTPNGKVSHLINISIDITQRQKTEEELAKLAAELEERVRDRSEKLELALRASHMGTWEWNIKTGELIWSNQLKSLYGLKPKDIITYELYISLIHAADRKEMQKIVKAARKTGNGYQIEHRVIWPDGSVHWILGLGKAFLENGKAVRMTGTSINIDTRKAADEGRTELLWREQVARRQAEIEKERLYSFFMQAPAIVNILRGPEHIFELFHPLAKKIVEGRDFTGMKVRDALPEYKGQRYFEILDEVYQTGKSYSEREMRSVILNKNGNPVERYFDVSFVPWRDADGQIAGIMNFAYEVTEQVKAHQQLEESEQRFRTMADGAPVLIWEAGPDKMCTYFNKHWLSFTGRTLKEELGNGWKQDIHPEDLETCWDTFSAAYDDLRPFRSEYRLRRNDGEYRWVVDHGIPRFSPDGGFQGFIGSCVDVEEIKHKRSLTLKTAFLTQKHAELLTLNRAKDDFISIASHQLRTPATAVKQYTGMLLEGYVGNLTKQQKKVLQTVFESNERQLVIIDDLLKIAHLDAGKVSIDPEPANLVGIMKSVLREQSAKFKKKKQKIALNSSDKEIIANVDADRIRMVFDNLIDNASKYTPAGKHVLVEFRQDKKNIIIEFVDEGVGIAKKDISKLFEKFSRIDNPLSTIAGGTGLGLYWVKQIIDMHQGKIKVISKQGKGSRFIIYLPKGDI